MKKAFVYLMAFALLLPLVSCSTGETDPASSLSSVTSASAPDPTPVPVPSPAPTKTPEDPGLFQRWYDLLFYRDEIWNEIDKEGGSIEDYFRAHRDEIAATEEIWTNEAMQNGALKKQCEENYRTFFEGRIEIKPTVPEVLPDYEAGSVRLDDSTKENKFRASYYDIGNYIFILSYLLDMDVDKMINPTTGNTVVMEIYDVFYQRDASHGSPKDPETHALAVLISYLRIPRSEMEKLVEILDRGYYEKDGVRYAAWQGPGGDFGIEDMDHNMEYYELPNLDVLYTLDDDIINAYYLRR